MKKLLIANRGEIAVRVLRAAREAGLRSAAVCTESDRDLPHAWLADEVHPIESYLDLEGLIRLALASGCDALHPGYGFLSERPELSAACREAGITFLGPSPEAMRRLGSKADAKQLAERVGVPLVPGAYATGLDLPTAQREAERIGYPVLLKASAGGGGRGMRRVEHPSEFSQAWETARQEAEAGFGDGALMVERYVARPRHIEVQVVADAHGGVHCVFERECSPQRRHQKLLEESPAPGMTPELWEAMREACERLLSAGEYTGAGTVEFLVEPDLSAFYFLEVNARLQVEHPVTELVSGVDLVHAQFAVARGGRLDLELPARPRGHAIEARVVAEDPAHGFAPSAGTLLAFALPSGPGVRVDTGYAEGVKVGLEFDSLLAKVIVHAPSRELALRRLEVALRDTHILGLRTNIGFLLAVLGSAAYQEGQVDTGWIEREMLPWAPPEPPPELPELARLARSASGPGPSAPAWAADGFRIARL